MNTNTQEFEHIEQSGRTLSVLIGLVVGGLLGAGTMLLFAPQPGKKTRAELQVGALELRRNGRPRRAARASRRG